MEPHGNLWRFHGASWDLTASHHGSFIAPAGNSMAGPRLSHVRFYEGKTTELLSQRRLSSSVVYPS